MKGSLRGPSWAHQLRRPCRRAAFGSKELLRVSDPRLLELLQPVLHLVQISLAVMVVVSAADVHSAVGHLLLADHCGGEEPSVPEAAWPEVPKQRTSPLHHASLWHLHACSQNPEGQKPDESTSVFFSARSPNLYVPLPSQAEAI